MKNKLTLIFCMTFLALTLVISIGNISAQEDFVFQNQTNDDLVRIHGDTGNITVTGDVSADEGFFDFLGSIANRITGLFVQDINASGDISVGGDLDVGTDVLFVDSTGDVVGIGTVNPQNKLNVVGDVNATETIYAGEFSGPINWTNLQNYPAACGANEAVQVIGDTLSCIEVASSAANGTGTPGYLTRWVTQETLGDSLIYQNGTLVGIRTETPGATLDVNGTGSISGDLYVGGTTSVDGDVDVTGNVTASWFSGIYDWIVGTASQAYLSFNGTQLDFNEAQLNTTIDLRDDDTLGELGCSDTEIAKWNATSLVWECSQDLDTDTLYYAGGVYIYKNNSDYFFLNETKLNQTIDLRDDDTTYDTGTGLNLSGTTFSFNETYGDLRFVNENQVDSITSAMIVDGDVGNVDLANSTLTIIAGTGLTGGGPLELGGQTTLNVNTTYFNENYVNEGDTGTLHVNISDWWNTGDQGALRNISQVQGSWINNDLAWINFTDGDGRYVLLTEEGNLNVNRSEWWRTSEGDLNDVSDLLGSWLTNDLQWINFTQGDTRYILLTDESNLNVNSSDFWITNEGIKQNVVDILGSEITNDLGWINFTQADPRYVNVDGDTMTGSLAIDANLSVGTDVLFADSNGGLVGIGTVNPQNKLSVAGDINATETVYAGEFSGPINWTNLQNYPAGCGANEAVQVIGDTLTCVNLSEQDSDTLDGYDSSFFMPLNKSVYGTFDFNDGWTGGGLTIDGGDLYAQTLYVYNITSLNVTHLNVNGSLLPQEGYDNTFDVGSPTRRWRDVYATTVYSGGNNLSTGYEYATNETYVPYVGATKNVDLGANNLTVDTNVLHIDSNNNRVGIGTDSPSQKLDIYESSGAVQLKVTSGDNVASINLDSGANRDTKIGFSDSGSSKWFIGNDGDTDNFAVGTDGGFGDSSDKITITQAGNVGIGTSDPSRKLEINEGDILLNNSDIYYVDHNGFERALLYADESNGVVTLNSQTNMKLVTSSLSQPIAFYQGNTNEIARFYNGNLGIGTISPQQKLHVNGSAVFNGTLNVDSNKIINLANGTSSQDAVAFSQLQSVNDSATEPETDPFWSGNYSGLNSNQVIFGQMEQDGNLTWDDTNKRLGIGTGSPTEELEIKGDVVRTSPESSSFQSKNYIINRTVGNNSGDITDIGTFTFTNGAGYIEIDHVAQTSGYSVAAKYLIPVQYGNQDQGINNEWLKVQPISYTGDYGGNEVEIDVNITSNKAHLRLRRASGPTIAEHTLDMKTTGNVVTFTPSSSTSTGASTPSEVYGPSVLTQRGGNVGIGTSNPGDKLTVSGGNIAFDTTNNRAVQFPAGSGLEIRYDSSNDQMEIGRLDDGYTAFAVDTSGIYAGAGLISSLQASKLNLGANDYILLNDSENFYDFYIDDSQEFRLSSSGDSYLNSGNFGIGTTSPTQKLEVNGTAGYESTDDMGSVDTSFASKGYVDNQSGSGFDGSGTANYVTKWQDADTLTDSVIYDDGTNVGIGTSNPNYPVHLNLGTNRDIILGNVSGLTPSEATSVTHGIGLSRTIDGAFTGLIFSEGDSGGGSQSIGIGSRNNIYFYGNQNRTVTFLETGNVGIGTTPTERLHVAGGNLFVESGQSNAQLSAKQSTGNWVNLQVGSSAANFVFNAPGGGGTGAFNIRSSTSTDPTYAGTDLLSILNTGEVGINTTSPQSTLEVSGTFNATSNGGSMRTDSNGNVKIGI